jgi:hypothetical protein
VHLPSMNSVALARQNCHLQQRKVKVRETRRQRTPWTSKSRRGRPRARRATSAATSRRAPCVGPARCVLRGLASLLHPPRLSHRARVATSVMASTDGRRSCSRVFSFRLYRSAKSPPFSRRHGDGADERAGSEFFFLWLVSEAASASRGQQWRQTASGERVAEDASPRRGNPFLHVLSPALQNLSPGCLACWRTNWLSTVTSRSHFCFCTLLLESVLAEHT